MIDEREPQSDDTTDRIEDEDGTERWKKEIGEFAGSLVDVPEIWARKIGRWLNGL